MFLQCKQFAHHCWKQDVSCMRYDRLLGDAKANFLGLFVNLNSPYFDQRQPQTTAKQIRLGSCFWEACPVSQAAALYLWAGREKKTILAFLCAESSRIAVNTRVHSQAFFMQSCLGSLWITLFFIVPLSLFIKSWLFFLAFIRVAYSCWGIHTMQFLLLIVCIKILYLKLKKY